MRKTETRTLGELPAFILIKVRFRDDLLHGTCTLLPGLELVAKGMDALKHMADGAIAKRAEELKLQLPDSYTILYIGVTK